MRKFEAYKNELIFSSNISIGEENDRVKQIQEWLIIHGYKTSEDLNILEKVDGKFGNNTLNAVKKFQINNRLIESGIIDKLTFDKLTFSIKNAFSIATLQETNLRNLIIEIATNHLKNNAIEILNKNRNKGPWVRAYCNGDDYKTSDTGPRWCAGFVKTIIDMACDKLNKNFNTVYKNSLDCDEIANWAIEKNYLISNSNIKNNIRKIKKGDLFLIKSTKTALNWIHIGIIKEIKTNGDFTSIEGNASQFSEIDAVGERVIQKNRNFHSVFYFDADDKHTLTKESSNYENHYDIITLDL